MEERRVRIDSITINNVKCVKCGSIEFNAIKPLRREASSIKGVYGQNGSGKTVVVEVIAILKAILSGKQVSNRYLESISFGEKFSRLEAVFSVVENEGTDYTVTYRCDLERRKNPNDSYGASDSRKRNIPNSIIAVTSESIKVTGWLGGVRYPAQFIAHTDELQQLIQPKNKCILLFGDDDAALMKLNHDKILALYGSRSFIFSDQATEAIEKNCAHVFGGVISTLKSFARYRLFVVGGETQSETPLPINFINKNKGTEVQGQILFSLEGKTNMPKSIITVFESFMVPLNLVLSSMIPGLQIVYNSQKLLLDDNNDEYEVELFSARDPNNIFPLRHESLGIKKIVSFLSLLIATYNDPGFVLVVDEFDSSVFEFLLGELISIMKTSGRGQLIFTSHNLRPLEKLDDASICFTTTDPENRYVRLKKKATNNLRDVYFRVLSLGSDDYELYSSESKNALAYALRQAGGVE